jgi:pantoate--beta-alanine ligase
MEVVEKLESLRLARSRLRSSVGLVPTMGFLHDGHLSLVRRARQENSSVVVSIFVNPTQFGPNEDLAAYPRDLPTDLHLLETEGVDLVWAPAPEIVYPLNYQTWVTVETITKSLEGQYRPGHFRGVATVVAKLFNATKPERAYFGQKDAQQVAVIRRMVKDLNFDLEVIVCPIVREPDGLAMSSRNVNLSPAERQAATVLFRSLSAATSAFVNGVRDAGMLREKMKENMQPEPLINPQYLSCADPDTLQELEGEVSGQALLSMAVFIGKTRLIDNMLIGE